jgi:hypothetical protein
MDISGKGANVSSSKTECYDIFLHNMLYGYWIFLDIFPFHKYPQPFVAKEVEKKVNKTVHE